MRFSDRMDPPMKHPSLKSFVLTSIKYRGTVPGRQFKWGACLQKSNGGAYQGWLGPDGNRPGGIKP